MSEKYRFVFGEVKAIGDACALVQRMGDEVNYAHVETHEYDMDVDLVGVVIQIPHDFKLDHERR